MLQFLLKPRHDDAQLIELEGRHVAQLLALEGRLVTTNAMMALVALVALLLLLLLFLFWKMETRLGKVEQNQTWMMMMTMMMAPPERVDFWNARTVNVPSVYGTICKGTVPREIEINFEFHSDCSD